MSKPLCLRFKTTTSDNMRRYLRFLVYHHEYSLEKILKTFPEYVEVTNEKRPSWRDFF